MEYQLLKAFMAEQHVQRCDSHKSGPRWARAKREKQRLKAQKKGKTGLVATGEEFDQEVDESLAQAAGAALGAAALKGGVSLIRAKAKKERGRMSGERKVAKAKFKADAKAQGRRKDIGKKK